MNTAHRKNKGWIGIFIGIMLSIFIITSCSSSKYGQVPCPCSKKSQRR